MAITHIRCILLYFIIEADWFVMGNTVTQIVDIIQFAEYVAIIIFVLCV